MLIVLLFFMVVEVLVGYCFAKIIYKIMQSMHKLSQPMKFFLFVGVGDWIRPISLISPMGPIRPMGGGNPEDSSMGSRRLSAANTDRGRG